MQLALTALGKLFGGGAAAGAAGAAAGGSGALTVLQGVAATVGVLAKIGAANAEARHDENQALEAELQAGQEKVKASQRQLGLKKELARVLGENEVTFAAAGIDISGGIAEGASRTAKRETASELSIDRRDQEFQSALFRARARGLRTRAQSRRGGALLGALADGANFALDISQRG